MDLKIHVKHYCLNLTLCRWPPCHPLHCCSCGGMDIMSHCSISM